MKALFIYSQYSAEDIHIMEQAKSEMSGYVEIIEINQASPELRRIIRATPALIPVVDDLQGDFIKGEGVDGKLIATTAMYKWLQKEEEVVHNQKTERLDNFVNGEKTKAVDNYTMELILDGRI